MIEERYCKDCMSFIFLKEGGDFLGVCTNPQSINYNKEVKPQQEGCDKYRKKEI